MKLNENIAKLRKEKGITQEELAVAVGVTNQTVSKWESGRCCPNIDLLPSLASYFEISIDELMGHEPVEKEVIVNSETKSSTDESSPFMDEEYPNALIILRENGKITTAILQMKLRLGYNRAKRIIEKLREQGYVTLMPNGIHIATEKAYKL